MSHPKFSPGFRFSFLDLIVLVVGAVSVVLLWSVEWWLSLIVCVPFVHFFLFCNIFRVSRMLELTWAGVYITLAGSTIVCGIPGWWPTAIVSVLVAAVIVLLEMRKPYYHGIGWQRINPGLPSLWEKQHSVIKETNR